jgi:ATP-dependent helicase/DNAse subunit B
MPRYPWLAEYEVDPRVVTARIEALREKVEGHLREYGRRIFEGDTAVAPFRIGKKTACDWCDFRSGCRFDSWTQPYRELRRPPRAGAGPAGGNGGGEES